MKQAIKIDTKNVYLISRCLNNQLKPEQLFSERGRWVVAEKHRDESIGYSLLNDDTFHGEYQIRPRPEALEDLRLDLWVPVVHRDTVAEEGVDYLITYHVGDSRTPQLIQFKTRQEAVETWDRWNSSHHPEFKPLKLEKIEVLRDQTNAY